MSFFRTVVWFPKGLREYTKGGYEKASRNFGVEDLKVDIGQRCFMVTGANSGIGKAAALTLARMGGVVHMVCRNRERGEAALQEVLEASGNTINNAGMLVSEKERQFTEDGLEVTFATNTLGTHIMTKSFIPILSRHEDPRVVIVTSGGMLLQKLDVMDLQFASQRPFDGAMAYAQTKRQQVVMAEQYSHRWPTVHFSSMHPGWADTPGVQTSLPDFHSRLKDRLRTPEQGADTVVWLAVAACVGQQPSGLFFQDRKAVSTHLPLAWTRSDPQQHQQLMKVLDDMAAQVTE